MQNLSTALNWAKLHSKYDINKGGICEMLLTKKRNKQSGFTIVELLIVIVIIGILATLVLNTFQGAQAKARDSKRDTDIKAISTQLEACYNDDSLSTSCNAVTAVGGYPLDITATNLKNLDPNALKAGGCTSSCIIATGTPTKNQYLYTPLQADGTTTCSTAPCAKYVLKWFREKDGLVQVKNSLN